MKKLLEKLLQMQQPDSKVDTAISASALFSMILNNLMFTVRRLKVWFYFKNPRNMMLGRGVKFFAPGDMKWGKNVFIGDHVYLQALGKDSLIFGDNSGIGSFSRVVTSVQFWDISGFIKLGHNASIGEFAHLGGAGGLEIGNDTFVGSYFSCHPENHRFQDTDKLYRHQGVTRKGIKIGRNCWIGAKVTVLDGVTIGDNCILAAGAVISKSFGDNKVIGGVPAKVIKELPAPEYDPPVYPDLI
jgi:acetyltransferase-like isoleucine patch superfamily enzyme